MDSISTHEVDAYNKPTLNKSQRRNGDGKKAVERKVGDEDNRKTLAYKIIALLSPFFFSGTLLFSLLEHTLGWKTNNKTKRVYFLSY